jgi:hypothetical protein
LLREANRAIKAIAALIPHFADRAVAAEAKVATLRSLAKRAVNGWACYAKRKLEHEEIAQLHRAIDEATNGATSNG